MKIKATMERIPGGMMLIPLLLGAILNTFAPDTGAYFGSFTKGMISGTVPILAVWFFCIGASIDLRATGTVLRKSGTLVLTKIGVAWVVAMIAASFIPEGGIQTGFFAGISVLAIVSAMDMTNGGLYASLMNQYGTKEESGAFVLMSLESGPLMTMVILGSAGLASFEPHHFIGAVLPFLIGFTLGNLDHDLRAFFSKATPVLIPFFGFALGNTINLAVIVHTGLLGIVLGVAVIIITGIPLIIADRVIGGGNGTAGVAASSAAGAAVANPVIIAQINPAFEPVAASATALVAASVIVTAILVPIITALYAKHVGGHRTEPVKEPEQQVQHHESLTNKKRRAVTCGVLLYKTIPVSGGKRIGQDFVHHCPRQTRSGTQTRHTQRHAFPALRDRPAHRLTFAVAPVSQPAQGIFIIQQAGCRR